MGSDKQNLNLLIGAFDTFKKASVSLEGYYRELEKRIEELKYELAEKNNYLTGILEALPVGIIVADNRGRIETVNNAVCSIMDEPPEGLIGRDIISLGFANDCGQISNLHPDCSAHSDNKEGVGTLKTPNKLDNYKPDESGSRTEENRFIDFEITIRGGKRKKTIDVNSTAIRNLQGEGTGCLIVIKDISEIKKLRESAQRDKRLKAMGEMAASIAHQIRNPLGSIELFASLLDEEGANEKESQRFAKEIVHAVRTLNNTLSNMLLFANNSKPFKAAVPVGDVIEESVDTCRFLLIGKKVSIETLHDTPALPLYVDKELFKQVFLNLIMNAVDAINGKGDGRISILSRKERDGIHIFISDNGCGISDDDLDEIFNPFFTKKPKGTGLGLTVVNNIVKAHGGIITVESSAGKGTTFDITLPEVERECINSLL
ncbi:MAG: PAS domain-containing protein [Deltaproteobacteria bacterium]|nr:PAS domain-containing protein [Deltaproteobacteria bacterium]